MSDEPKLPMSKFLVGRKRRYKLSGEGAQRPKPSDSSGAADTEASAGSPAKDRTVKGPTEESSASRDAPTSYARLQSVPWEPVPAQATDLLKKVDVALLLTPPGACNFAMKAYFIAFLAGRTFSPFGPARYPADVIYITYKPDHHRAMRAAVSSCIGPHDVFIPVRPKRFNWKKPLDPVNEALAERKHGPVSAIVIDVGANAPRSGDVADQAYLDLRERAAEVGCLILLVTTTTSKAPDPYDRVPRSLRDFDGTILAAPLLPKAPLSRFGTLNEFLLLRLVDVAPNAPMVRFTLTPAADCVERSYITWGNVYFDNPRVAFARAEADDVPPRMLEAISLAMEVIRRCGPMTTVQLQAAGEAHDPPVAKTTMRAALHLGSVHNYVRNESNFLNQRFWIIPGTTPFSRAFGTPDGSLPF